MNFLVSLTPEYAQPEDRAKYAPDGEPVIPCFPAPLENLFLSTVSFKRCLHAEVRNVQIDLDAVCSRLASYYPGLPRRLIENYLFHAARAAAAHAVGTRFRVFITLDEAKIQNLESEELYVLWTAQPME